MQNPLFSFSLESSTLFTIKLPIINRKVVFLKERKKVDFCQIKMFIFVMFLSIKKGSTEAEVLLSIPQ